MTVMRRLACALTLVGAVLPVQAASANGAPVAASDMRIAFMHANNVYLMNVLGGNQTTLTTRGTDLLPPYPFRYLIYSSVDNPWRLWQHRLPGNRYIDDLLQRYGPRVRIQRLKIGGQPVTIAVDAGRPTLASSLSSAPASTPSGPIVLGSKSFITGGKGWGTVKPSKIDNNGDPGGKVQGIRWQHWGEKTAFGWGFVFIENPSGPGWGPLVRAELRASDIGRCTARGPLVYRRLHIREPTRQGGPLRPWANWSPSGTLCRWS